jgi:Family of unknown function (DUF6088)
LNFFITSNVITYVNQFWTFIDCKKFPDKSNGLKKMKEEYMCTSAFIKRHIFSLPKGIIFSTRQMLNYGRRSAVDQCLYRLVKTGRIIRLAWGLFMVDDPNVTMPSSRQVATEKARAFSKQILTDAVDAAQHLGLIKLGNSKTTYAIQGHSSQFKYGETTIHFKGICQRKIALGDQPVGLAIKALWQYGKTHCHQIDMIGTTAQLNRPQHLEFRQSCQLMPVWMTNIFKK